MTTKFSTLRKAQAAAKQNAATMGHANIQYVLRPDGDTDIYVADDNGKVTHEKSIGWIAQGNVVSPVDVPCIL